MTTECPASRRVDGPKHSWRFDGDDPYVVCVYCFERRDTITSAVVSPSAPPDKTPKGPRRDWPEASVADGI